MVLACTVVYEYIWKRWENKVVMAFGSVWLREIICARKNCGYCKFFLFFLGGGLLGWIHFSWCCDSSRFQSVQLGEGCLSSSFLLSCSLLPSFFFFKTFRLIRAGPIYVLVMIFKATNIANGR